MSIAIGGGQAAAPIPVGTPSDLRAPRLRRGLLAVALLAGAGWAVHAGSPAETADAVARAGSDLTRLLRCMAVLKAAMAAAALAAVWWRLALPAGAGWTVAYMAAGAAASAGPVLIWGMVHLGLGALLLHAGPLRRAGAAVARPGRRGRTRRDGGRAPADPRVPLILSAAAATGKPGPRPCRFRPAR